MKKRTMAGLAALLFVLMPVLLQGTLATGEARAELDTYWWRLGEGEASYLLLDPYWFCAQLEGMGYQPQRQGGDPPTVETAQGSFAFTFAPEIRFSEYSKITWLCFPAEEALEELVMFAENHGIPGSDGPWRIHEGKLYIKVDAGTGILESMGYTHKEKDNRHIGVDETGSGYARNGILYTRIRFASPVMIAGEAYTLARSVFRTMTQVGTTIGVPGRSVSEADHGKSFGW